jgi:glycosyltransferase involved in cell wall biosynthesis
MIQSKINKPEISVLMSIYTESADAINVAVESILKQTFTNFELILVNDNPKSADTQKILDVLSTQDDRIHVLTNDCNRGLGYALNAAIQSSRADIVARMDTEDTSHPERLAKQISFMKTHTDVDLLFTQWIDINECDETVIRQPHKIDFINIRKSFFTKSLLMHPTLIARKEVLLDNPYLEMGRPEDIVLWLQLIRKGYAFDILEEPLYRYRIDRINIVQRYAKIRTYSQNLLPHLVRESRYYWSNIYFWLYFGRILFEYLISRNTLIFNLTHARAARMWKTLFGT